MVAPAEARTGKVGWQAEGQSLKAAYMPILGLVCLSCKLHRPQ